MSEFRDRMLAKMKESDITSSQKVQHHATKYHDLAMELAECAIVLKHMGLNNKAEAVSHYASVLESKAAHYSNGYALSQGILYRSAAWLAYHGDDSEKAIEYAELGLKIEDLAEEIRDELREVLEVAKRWTDRGSE